MCSDPFLTSADPVDAHLMDGRCMQQWAHRALAASRARLLQVGCSGLTAHLQVLSSNIGALFLTTMRLAVLSVPGDPHAVLTVHSSCVDWQKTIRSLIP